MLLLMWLFFIILNGKWTAEIALLGVAVAAAVFLFTRAFLDWSLAREINLLRRLPRLAMYGTGLVWEIFKANLATLRRIYSRKPVRPAIVTLRPGMKARWRTQLLANSITLTPGTISVACDEEQIAVHCLEEDFAEGLEDMAEGVRGLGAKK